MAFARARAAQTLRSSLRYSGQRVAPRISGPGRTQLVQRRYASGGGHADSGSDLPWAIAAVAVTIPSCWYLWPESSHADAGHGHEGSEEGGHAHDEEQKEALKEQPSDTPEPDGEEGTEESEEDQKFEKQEEEKQDSEPTKSSGDAQDSEPPGGEDKQEGEGDGKDDSSSEEKSEAKSDSGEGKSESGEGKSDSGEEKEQSSGDTDESESKGESGEGKDETDSGGEVKDSSQSRGTKKKKLPDTGKELGKQNPEGKGMRTAKHSTQIDQDPTKSTKGEGTPETATANQTVDPARPAK